MKTIVSLSVLLFFCGDSFNTAQDPGGNQTGCGFAVNNEPIRASVMGPDEIVPLTYIVEQPDSPIEIVSVDLHGTSLAITEEGQTTQYTVQSCANYKVHNRSDRDVAAFDLELLVTAGEGGAPNRVHNSLPLMPGQTAEIKACPGIQTETAASKSRISFLVSVESADLKDCFYRPSLRIPRSLGVKPIW